MKRTYSNVAATIALVVALGGGSAAYALDGSNTVFSDDIVDGQVTEKDLAPDSVGSSELAPGAVGPINEAVPYGGEGHIEKLPLSQKQSNGFVGLDTITWKEASGGAGGGRTAWMGGALEIANPKDGSGEALVTVRVLMDGLPEETSYRQTIPEGGFGSVPVEIRCDGMPAGLHTARLQVRTTGADITTTNGDFGLISFGPIFNPPAA